MSDLNKTAGPATSSYGLSNPNLRAELNNQGDTVLTPEQLEPPASSSASNLYGNVRDFLNATGKNLDETIKANLRKGVSYLYPSAAESMEKFDEASRRASQLYDSSKMPAAVGAVGAGAGLLSSLAGGGGVGRALYQGAGTGLGAGLGFAGARYLTPKITEMLPQEYQPYASYLKYILPTMGGGLGYLATRGKTAFVSPRSYGLSNPSISAELIRQGDTVLTSEEKELAAGLVSGDLYGTGPFISDFRRGVRAKSYGRRKLRELNDAWDNITNQAASEKTFGEQTAKADVRKHIAAIREKLYPAIERSANEKTLREQTAKTDERLAKAKLKPEPPAKTEPAAKMPPLDKYQELTNLLALAGAGGVAGASLGGLVGSDAGNTLGGAARGAIIGTSSGAGLGLGNTLANKIISGLPAESSPLTTNLLRLGLPAAGLGSGFYLSSALTKPRKRKKKKSD